MKPTDVKTLENGNHNILLADCLSEYEVGNLVKERLGSGGDTVFQNSFYGTGY